MTERFAILQRLDDSDVEWLLSSGASLNLAEGQTLITAGQPPDSMYVVETGALGVFAPNGGRKLATIGPGEFLGDMTWLESRPPTESVVALEPSTVLAVSHGSLDTKVSEDGGFARRLHLALARTLAERLRRVNVRLALQGDTEASRLSRSPSWPKIADVLLEIKNAVHEANEAALQNDGVVPEDLANAFVDRFLSFYPFLELMVGEQGADDEQTRDEIGGRVQRELLPFVLLTEAAERALSKPRGYAGDYWTIELFYRNRPSGASRIGPLLDRCFLDAPACRAVRNRRLLMAKEIQATLASKNGEGAAITSLACGPAEEVFDAFALAGHKPALRANLVDFDFQALAFVAERRDRMKLDRAISLVPENLIHLILGRTQTKIENQDLVYSIGLIDYFNDDLVVKFLNLVHRMLRPGGRAIVGNFHPKNPCRAFMDYVLEWKLKHRTEDDMHRLFAESRFGRPCTRIQYEDQQINLFAECVK